VCVVCRVSCVVCVEARGQRPVEASRAPASASASASGSGLLQQEAGCRRLLLLATAAKRQATDWLATCWQLLGCSELLWLDGGARCYYHYLGRFRFHCLHLPSPIAIAAVCCYVVLRVVGVGYWLSTTAHRTSPSPRCAALQRIRSAFCEC
jgi:hypothetical protein